MPGARSDTPASALLAVTGLMFSRNEEWIFGPLDFHLECAETLLIEGGNGAGKTTLLRVLAGLLRADQGQIVLNGRKPDPLQRARTISYLGHLPAFKADLSAMQNLHFLCDLHGARTAALADAMQFVGLAGYEDTPARQLSAGQKKRLSLARIWLSPATLWLLDEPYANLDLNGIELVNQMVRAHLEKGGATLLTTHGAYAAPPVRTRVLPLGACQA